jgi:hypothetical protein
MGLSNRSGFNNLLRLAAGLGSTARIPRIDFSLALEEHQAGTYLDSSPSMFLSLSLSNSTRT